jgi:cysteine desulfurase
LRDLRNRQLSTFNFQLSTVKNRFPIFHTDACKAPLYLNCLVNALGVDLMTLDGHKMYGPKGVGALYVRRGTPLKPLILGGGQERGLRSTTENVPGIAGLAEALRIAAVERKAELIRLEKLRDYLYSTIRTNGGIDMVVNGSMERGERLPNNLNISLPEVDPVVNFAISDARGVRRARRNGKIYYGVDTEFLTLQLDARGIAVSTKSSCLKDEKSSYVVAALGGGKKRSSSTLRFTLGRWTKKSDIEYAAKAIVELIQAEQ